MFVKLNKNENKYWDGNAVYEIVPFLFLPLSNRPTLSVQRDFVDKGQIDKFLGDILRQRGAMVL